MCFYLYAAPRAALVSFFGSPIMVRGGTNTASQGFVEEASLSSSLCIKIGTLLAVQQYEEFQRTGNGCIYYQSELNQRAPYFVKEKTHSTARRCFQIENVCIITKH